MAHRTALIIGDNPQQVSHTATLLHQPALAHFDTVETLVEPTSEELRRRLVRLFYNRRRDDFVLLHFMGQIIPDPDDPLNYYLGAANTDRTTADTLIASAVSVDYLREQSRRCAGRYQVLVLDGWQTWKDDQRHLINRLTGRGRTVITTMQYGHPHTHAFTKAWCRGLNTGAADQNQSGLVYLSDLYHYAVERVEQANVPHTYQMWSHAGHRDLVLARNPYLKAKHKTKWDLILGAVVTSLVTLLLGSYDNLTLSVGFALFFLGLYSGLYYWLSSNT